MRRRICQLHRSRSTYYPPTLGRSHRETPRPSISCCEASRGGTSYNSAKTQDKNTEEISKKTQTFRRPLSRTSPKKKRSMIVSIRPCASIFEQCITSVTSFCARLFILLKHKKRRIVCLPMMRHQHGDTGCARRKRWEGHELFTKKHTYMYIHIFKYIT